MRCRLTNTTTMLLSSFDTAPLSGDYIVYAADGHCVGFVRLAKGAAMPPCLNGLNYFEFCKEAPPV